MAAVGRILSTIGWLWFVAGIGAPIFDLEGLNVFPGLILVLVGRLLRSQAKRGESADQAEEVETEPEAHPLNTERARSGTFAEPAPSPVPAPPPPGPVIPTAPRVPIELSEAAEEKVTDVTGPIFPTSPYSAAGEAKEEAGDESVPTDRSGDGLLSSEEMINRARQRWGRRP